MSFELITNLKQIFNSTEKDTLSSFKWLSDEAVASPLFPINEIDKKVFRITTSNQATFSLNIFDNISISQANLRFLLILYHLVISDPSHSESLQTFVVKLGGGPDVQFTTSQLILSNIRSWNEAILIDTLQALPINRTGRIIVIAGGE